MRIDAHHHFWQLGRFQYSWITPELAELQYDFLPADLRPLLDQHGIDRTVLVQTIGSVPETQWFLELAGQHDWIAGVVGWVDLTDPAVGDTLAALAEQPRLVGIRHVVHDEPDDRWLARADVRQGLNAVAERGLCFDLLLRPRHLEVARELVDAMPQMQFVVDHIAKPRIQSRGWDDWAEPLRQLAARPNVACKLSGMVTEADLQVWQPADLQPYVDHALECFGPARSMYGSDWPVCLLAGSYERVFEAVNLGLSKLTPAEQSEIMGNTAVRIYKLKDSAGQSAGLGK